jgi:hypothetical protein
VFGAIDYYGEAIVEHVHVHVSGGSGGRGEPHGVHAAAIEGTAVDQPSLCGPSVKPQSFHWYRNVCLLIALSADF